VTAKIKGKRCGNCGYVESRFGKSEICCNWPIHHKIPDSIERYLAYKIIVMNESFGKNCPCWKPLASKEG